MVIIPEIILLHYTKQILQLLRLDLSNNTTTPNESLLYLLFNNKKIEKYGYYTQLAEILNREEDHSKFLDVDLMFNMERDGAPSIHITVPGETGAQNSLGVGIGSLPSFEVLGTNGNPSEYYHVFSRRYKATYDIVITSDNSNEVVAIYHLLRTMFTGLQTSLELEGLQNISLSGQDLTPYTEVGAKNLYVRAIRMQLEYESGAVDIRSSPIFSSFTIHGFAKNP